MNIKTLKKYLQQFDDEDIVKIYTYDDDGDYVRKLIPARIRIRRPKHDDVNCTYCQNYEEIEVKGKNRSYCNHRNDIINNIGTCDAFESDDDIKFCLNCERCTADVYCQDINDDGLYCKGDWYWWLNDSLMILRLFIFKKMMQNE